MNIQPQSFNRRKSHAGVTLIELTVVIVMAMVLVSILYIGAKAWKRGSDRAGCVVQIRQVQTGVRSFANLNGYIAEQSVAPLDLKAEVVGPGRFVASPPACPANGTYTYSGNMVPKIGELYMVCSLGNDEDHEPNPFDSW